MRCYKLTLFIYKSIYNIKYLQSTYYREKQEP